MSTIEEPPQDRYPVQTFVLEHQDGILDEAMRRELGRGGQVYYLHNRVESIDQCAAKIESSAFRRREVVVAHGKDERGAARRRHAVDVKRRNSNSRLHDHH